MSRPKVDPVERAFEDYCALTREQVIQFNYLLSAWIKWHRDPEPKPSHVRKTKEPSEVAAS